MNIPKVKCPRCGSYQRFANQTKKLEGNEIEVFIRCSACRWEQVVIRGDSDIIRKNRKIERRKIRAEKYPGLKKALRRKKRNNGKSMDSG